MPPHSAPYLHNKVPRLLRGQAHEPHAVHMGFFNYLYQFKTLLGRVKIVMFLKPGTLESSRTSRGWMISSNVAQCPHCLLADLFRRGHEYAYKDWDSPAFNHISRVLCCS